MKILSFNVLSQQLIGEFDEYINVSHKYLQKKYRYAKNIQLLKKYDADIILLQEVDPGLRKLIKQKCKIYKVLPIVRYYQDDSKYYLGEMVMLKKDKFKNIKQQLYVFERYNVGCPIVKCKMNNIEITIINVHLSDLTERIRMGETSELLKYVKKLDSELVIIGGDFNTDTNKLHTRYVKNGFRSVVSKKNKKSTYYCESPMIDYIYVKGYDAINGYIDNTVYDNIKCRNNTFKKYGSDHYPVIATIQN
jgi:endonuclease/exonuclease/phosphatase family metal-dependent hydrolase